MPGSPDFERKLILAVHSALGQHLEAVEYERRTLHHQLHERPAADKSARDPHRGGLCGPRVCDWRRRRPLYHQRDDHDDACPLVRVAVQGLRGLPLLPKDQHLDHL